MTMFKRDRISILALLLVALTAKPTYTQTFSVMYTFGSRSGDPIYPNGYAAQGRDGALYSTSYSGGAHGHGTVFKITPARQMRVIYSFCSVANCADGSEPGAGLTLRPNGHFIGTTLTGGSLGYGTIFDISQTGTLTVLYNFTGGRDGAYPASPPIRGTNGNFYGTTWEGGLPDGCGAIYGIATTGTLYGFTRLHDFNRTLGCEPVDSLVFGTDGNLYGSTVYGGSASYGVIFKVTSAGKVTVLHNFQGVPDGYYPRGPLVQGNDGNFYGATGGIGSPYGGGVFQITSSGTLSVLHNLNGTTDGEYVSGIMQASDGNFYGAAEEGGSNNTCNNDDNNCGTLFRVTSAGSFSVLYNFDGVTGYDAEAPSQHTNGILYGSSYWGGIVTGSCAPFGCGVFYRLDASLPAFVSLVPYQGQVGSTIEILGQGFTSSTTVSFNGTPAAAMVVAGNFVRTVVPSGATTGFVTVTTSGGTLTSNKQFLVTP